MAKFDQESGRQPLAKRIENGVAFDQPEAVSSVYEQTGRRSDIEIDDHQTLAIITVVVVEP